MFNLLLERSVVPSLSEIKLSHFLYDNMIIGVIIFNYVPD